MTHLCSCTDAPAGVHLLVKLKGGHALLVLTKTCHTVQRDNTCALGQVQSEPQAVSLVRCIWCSLYFTACRDAICALILGSPPGKVYSKLRSVCSRLNSSY